ncbi:Hint domain-containing protein [Paracoccus sp. Z330]|uniref:Hint domain-containing protein n=1 Tax=Paracoccus onchidii TaxID=3017813 RepID=A0ABT4ZF87_9RHOB|nr:Hint domain-containing protein [Paracoccus onchidii]MDB6178018.1 Hint domain-containing protein [Paracoccus onchidii]
MPTTWNAIYLGNSGSFNIDPIEGNSQSENADQLVGASAGSAASPLFERIVEVTALDRAGQAGSLDTDGGAGGVDQVSYTLPGETSAMVATFEGIAVYDATVTFLDGTTAQVSAVLFQDEARNFFLAPEITANADSAIYQQGPIESIELTALTIDTANLTADRQAADFVTCFVAGTLIETPDGLRPVEDLRAGDMVLTADHGARPLVWTGSRKLDSAAQPNLRPVRISARALGENSPNADLLLSQQHRILVRSAAAARMFDASEVLVAAKHLTGLPGIEIVEDAGQVTYVHLLFDQHEIVTANGAATESLFTGPEALKGVSEAAREEILALFPQLAEIGSQVEILNPARPLVSGRRGRKLAARHLANAKPMVQLH